MTKTERLAAVFAVVFAVIYAPTMGYNLTAATYHPIQGIWQLGFAKSLGGGSPAMYWYGFIITAALGAAVVTALAALIPANLMDRVPWRSLTWVVPIGAIIYIAYVLREYATRM
jgi:hypothetical protein